LIGVRVRAEGEEGFNLHTVACHVLGDVCEEGGRSENAKGVFFVLWGRPTTGEEKSREG